MLGTPDSVTQIKETLQSNSKNDKSQKRDGVFQIWSDALPQLSIEQPPNRRQKGKRCQTHTTCINQQIILLTCKYYWISGQSALSFMIG
jgi:hypothetical protein